MDESYAISEMYSELAEQIIKDKRPDILDAGISVGFISSDKQKKHGRIKLVLGECKKIDELHKLFCPYDFLIIIYDRNCEGLTDEQMKILLWHELNHIGIDPKTGDFFVKPHDVEEFDDIIREYGLHWQDGDNHG